MTGCFQLTGKVAIVTGASRGIGRAIALAFAREGAHVVAAARDASALDDLAGAIAGLGTGARCLVVAGDLRATEAPAALVTRAIAEFGQLDVVISNAGATKRGPFLEMADSDMLDGFALKYHAAVRLCRAAWPHLERAGGSITAIAGIGANTPSAEFTIGAPVNAALITFCKAIAEQGLTDGVRVNVISPGAIETERLTTRIDALGQREGLDRDAARARMLSDMRLARFGAPDDIAQAAVWLSSPLAGYVHGSVLIVDGGATRGL